MDINEERNKRKKQTGEYFTPEWLVRDMINKIPEEQWKDSTKTVLEPACGDGNFVEWIIRKKIECGSTIEQAINTTYAIDLMEDNVSETKKRVKRLILEFGGSKDLFTIVDNHIKCADFLKTDLDELFPEQNLNQSLPMIDTKQELVLDFGMEGGGESIYRESENGELRFLRKYSYMQFDLDDWKTGEELIPSVESFWNEFTNDPKWFRFHPMYVHEDYRPVVLKSLQQINLITINDNEKDSVEKWVRIITEGKYESDYPFKSQCRYHQSNYRSEVLKVWFDKDINVLLEDAGRDGLNFYDGFGIRNVVKKENPFRKPLYCNLLRSEHIPYNFFIPLDSKHNSEFCKQVFNDLLGGIIDSILRMEIEYAPSPKEKYLDDHTAFDTYIEYQHIDGTKGILGIEVKYTELSYPLKVGSTEHRMMTNFFDDSSYNKKTIASKMFQLNGGDFDELVKDRYRQVWRNHLLGESIIIKDGNEFKHFHSLTFYPSGNNHFVEVISEYKGKFLKPEYQQRVRGITYEHFFESCRKYIPNKHYKDWLDYLEKRYLF